MLKPIKRGVHFDFHNMPGIDNFGESFDAAKFAQQMADANVEYVNMFARCNIGFSYYKTKVGIEYPGMKGNMLYDVVRECHKRNIGVTGYLNAGMNHEISIRHPEWLQMNKNGQIYDMSQGGNFFRNICFNTEYLDYHLKELEEVVSLGVDGIFLDCIVPRACYCMKCTQEMLSLGIDISNEEEVEKFSLKVLMRACEKIRKVVPDNVRLIFNGMSSVLTKNLQSHREIECLPSAWSYDFFGASAAYNRPLFSEILYMNGRFQKNWGDFGGYKGRAAIENDFYDALTQGMQPMLGDHLHPARNPDAGIYKELGEIYGRLKLYERWTDGAKYISEVGVLYNEISNIHYSAARILAELKYDFDIVHTSLDFEKYKVIIMPDSIKVTPQLAEKLKKYLHNGGKIISTGFSGLLADESGFALPEWDFEYLGKNDSDTSYFKLETPINGLLDMEYSAYSPAIRMRTSENSTSLASEVDSYFNKTGWNGMHYVFYTPPKAENGNSAIAINSQGTVAHVSFSLFSAYFESFGAVFKAIIKKLLDMFMPDNLIKADSLPSTARVTLTGTEKYRLLHVKVTYPEIKGKFGIIESHNELRGGKEIAVKGEYSTVLRLPNEEPVPSRVENGYTVVTLPDIVGYDMFILK